MKHIFEYMTEVRRKLILITVLFLSSTSLFAREKLDIVLQRVSDDICARVSAKTIICVLDFDSTSRDMGLYIRDSLISSFAENPNIRIVTRQNMDKINMELDYQYSGYVSDETALSLCQRLGAQEIIFGQVDELDNSYTLQVKMLDVETGTYALFKKYEISRSSKTEQLLHHAATIYKSSLGLIIEANKNSISHISPAAGISFDYSLSRRLSFGVKALVSFDALEKDNTIYTIEPLGFLRWYVTSPTGEPSAGLFAEGQGGAEVILVNDEIKTTVSGGLSLGFRITAGNFYIEPSLRGGYPYLFGAGLGAGFRF